MVEKSLLLQAVCGECFGFLPGLWYTSELFSLWRQGALSLLREISMNKESDEALCRDFPKIFRDRYGNKRNTCMVWGFPGDGWEKIIRIFCTLAQNHIDQSREWRCRFLKNKRGVDRAIKHDKVREYAVEEYKHYIEPYRSEAIETIVKEPDRLYGGWGGQEPKACPQVIATQVKEKFGTLRFYYMGGDDFIEGLEAFMNYLSAKTCENCGREGKLRGGGWILCLCDECAEGRPTLEELEAKAEDEA